MVRWTRFIETELENGTTSYFVGQSNRPKLLVCCSRLPEEEQRRATSRSLARALRSEPRAAHVQRCAVQPGVGRLSYRREPGWERLHAEESRNSVEAWDRNDS